MEVEGQTTKRALLSTKQCMPYEQARRLAESKGGFIGQLLIRRGLSSLRVLHYPFFLVTLEVDYAVRKSKLPPQFKVVVDGTSGRCALVEEEPDLEALPAEATLVDVLLTTEEVVRYSGKHLNRYLIKTRHTAAAFKKEVVQLFYRPYWVAFYGDKEMGKKVWYLPYEADGYAFGHI